MYTVRTNPTPPTPKTIRLVNWEGGDLNNPTEAAEQAEQLYPGEWSSVKSDGGPPLTREQWLAERNGFLLDIAQQVGGFIETIWEDDPTPGITVIAVTFISKNGPRVSDSHLSGPVTWSAFKGCDRGDTDYVSIFDTSIPYYSRDTGRIVTWIKGIIAGLMG